MRVFGRALYLPWLHGPRTKSLGLSQQEMAERLAEVESLMSHK